MKTIYLVLDGSVARIESETFWIDILNYRQKRERHLTSAIGTSLCQTPLRGTQTKGVQT